MQKRRIVLKQPLKHYNNQPLKQPIKTGLQNAIEYLLLLFVSHSVQNRNETAFEFRFIQSLLLLLLLLVRILLLSAEMTTIPMCYDLT